MAKYWFGSMPWGNPQAYWKRSPLSLVGQVTTPKLVIVGDKDLRTPVSDAEQHFQALQLRGIPTALVKVPGASHGGLTTRPSQSAAKASAILAWFERYGTVPAGSPAKNEAGARPLTGRPVAAAGPACANPVWPAGPRRFRGCGLAGPA